MSGDRKTRSVCDGHDLGAFVALQDPFFCRREAAVYEGLSNINLASFIQVFCQLLCNALENTLSNPLLEPPMARLVQRIPLWQIFPGRPVRKIHNIPFKTSRRSRAGRPLGSFLGVNAKITGSIRLHCSFVSSILILLHNQELMSSFF
jgi:hypothetical protein